MNERRTAQESLARMNDAELKAFVVLHLSLYGQSNLVAIANDIAMTRMQSSEFRIADFGLGIS